MLGGPSIGDIRSRLTRLIPSTLPGSPLHTIRVLLEYRLPAKCSEREARDEWRDIVEGRSKLWIGIPDDRKETIRGLCLCSFSRWLVSQINRLLGPFRKRTAQESSQKLLFLERKVMKKLTGALMTRC